MTVAVFIPTNRPGGLDVTNESLRRQTYKEVLLIVCDELRRDAHWKVMALNAGFTHQARCMVPPAINKNSGEKRNLARAYNKAAQYAIEWECDLLISLQDYIWIPDDGIERFVELHQKIGHKKLLYTGLTSISADPLIDKVENLNGVYTIFKEPFKGKPSEISWHDVRYTEIFAEYFKEATVIQTNDPNSWEANWAAVPVELLKDGLRWDEQYDLGYACENNDLARQAINMGCSIVIDSKNHAISLPHFTYWPQEKEDLKLYNNKERYDAKWQDVT